MKHKIGNRYRISGNEYVLIGFPINGDEYIAMLNPKSGVCWDDPIRVKDFYKIDDEEFERILEATAKSNFSYTAELINN